MSPSLCMAPTPILDSTIAVFLVLIMMALCCGLLLSILHLCRGMTIKDWICMSEVLLHKQPALPMGRITQCMPTNKQSWQTHCAIVMTHVRTIQHPVLSARMTAMPVLQARVSQTNLLIFHFLAPRAYLRHLQLLIPSVSTVIICNSIYVVVMEMHLGTLWVTKNKDENCENSACLSYPYAFINYLADTVNETAYYLGSNCPAGIQYFGLSFASGKDQTLLAMTSLNLLTNSIRDPELQTFSLQGGYSHFGYLYFDAVAVNQMQAVFLTLIGVILINLLWPIIVWRLAYERSRALVTMQYTVGMNRTTYLLGMYLFDMITYSLVGIAVMIFAYLLKFPRFEDAPVGYLILLVILSGHALISSALLITYVAGKKASILPMICACLNVAGAVASVLLFLLKYPDDGDWEWPLSLIPFLAQSRALYILLVYQIASKEVVVAMWLLFLFGLVCLCMVFLFENEAEIRPKVHAWSEHVVKYFRRSPDHRRHVNPVDSGHEESGDMEMGTVPNLGYSKVTQQRLDEEEGVRRVDEDVRLESHRADTYFQSQTVPRITQQSAAQAAYAIVVSHLGVRFPPPVGGPLAEGFMAVKDVSLALSLGECFGLLGM